MGLFSRRNTGLHYEQVAADYLSRHALRLLEKNFTTRVGEIDLVMRDGSCLVFVEVKYRKNQSYGHAAEMVTSHKKLA
ncbi:endonuclease distantly-like archaeal Holliday junction resolvase [Vibrio metschnikovii]|nr:endonuclease distantly-like archaeal Holliday junction resolvase [Vibrio metschnikovii]